MPPVFLHKGRACITINYIMQWEEDGIWLYLANTSVISQEKFHIRDAPDTVFSP